MDKETTVKMLIDQLQAIEDKSKLVKTLEQWDGQPSYFVTVEERENEVFIYGE